MFRCCSCCSCSSLFRKSLLIDILEWMINANQWFSFRNSKVAGFSETKLLMFSGKQSLISDILRSNKLASY